MARIVPSGLVHFRRHVELVLRQAKALRALVVHSAGPGQATGLKRGVARTQAPNESLLFRREPRGRVADAT
eukprot:5814049-Lingulodinium_polyedra.AAC.1